MSGPSAFSANRTAASYSLPSTAAPIIPNDVNRGLVGKQTIRARALKRCEPRRGHSHRDAATVSQYDVIVPVVAVPSLWPNSNAGGS